MAAISPSPSTVQVALRPVSRNVRRFRAFRRWLRRVAGRLPGGFSIAKLDTFNRFRAQATPFWVLSILLLTPIPCFLLNFLLESIPLADPATGLSGSLHFQIRNYLTAATMTALPVFMKVDCIPEMSTISWKIVLGYAMITAAVAIANNAVISVIAGVFPILFTQFAAAGPMAVVGLVLNRLLPNNRKPEIKQRVQTIDTWLGMDMLPVVVYPVFTAVFMSLKPTHQLWLSLLLPVIKRLLRHVFWMMLRQDPDIAGATTCAVGHLYHVLFTAMCLQNAKSLETLAALIAVNVFHMLLNCRDILKDADRVRRAKAELRAFEVAIPDDMVSAAVSLAQEGQLPELLHRKSPSRLFSSYPGFQSVDFVKRHDRLLQGEHLSPRAAGFRRASAHRSLLSAKSLAKQTTPPIEQNFAQIAPPSNEPLFVWRRTPRGHGQLVLPTGGSSTDPRTRTAHSLQFRGDRTRKRELFVRSVASMMHQAEIILLRSYITIFMLSFYGIYLMLVFWLPNRKYFFTMRTMTTLGTVDSMMLHLLLLGSMELLFLGMYLVLISHQLGVSGVRLLAFVLWSQRVLLQSKILALSIMSLGFPLEHYGNSVIFQLKTG